MYVLLDYCVFIDLSFNQTSYQFGESEQVKLAFNLVGKINCSDISIMVNIRDITTNGKYMYV